MCGVKKKKNCKWLFSLSGIYTHGHLFEGCFTWLLPNLYVTGRLKGNDITEFPEDYHWSLRKLGYKLLSKEKDVFKCLFFLSTPFILFLAFLTISFPYSVPSVLKYLSIFVLSTWGLLLFDL